MVDATIETLIARADGTTAGTVPLVLNHDIVESGWSRRIRHNNFLSIYITERGRGIHVINAVPYGVSRGDVHVMASGSDHTFPDGENLLLHAAHFAPTIFDQQTWDAFDATPGFEYLGLEGASSRRIHLAPAAYDDVARDLTDMWAEWRTGTPAGAVLVRALFLRLLVRLARAAAGGGPRAPSAATSPYDREEIVASAVRTIDLMYAEPLRVERLASATCLSSARFTEIFKLIMGQTPRDYIRHVRIERARAMLSGTQASVSEVGRATGFTDSAYFARSFRAATGRSPREFRRESLAR